MSKPLLTKLQESLDSGLLFEIVDTCYASTQILRKLGYADKGQYITITRKFLVDNDIDISHFTPNGASPTKIEKRECPCCGKLFTALVIKSNDQVTCSKSCSNTYFRTKDGSKSSYRKRAMNHYGCYCSKCGFDNEKALEVHHIDKDRNNNLLSNLVVLCANCHLIEHRTE